MILKVFSVYDAKAQAYSHPFYRATKGLALRDFESTVNDQSTQFNKNPEDFTLFEVGEFDDSNGHFTNLKTPLSLGVAIEFKK